MIKITILEDEQPQLEQLVRFLKQYEQQNEDVVLDIQSFDRAMNLLDSYRCDADLLLLDIQLPDMTGMEAAKRIRTIDQNVMIIFITSLAQYAMEGYSVHAFDYMLKPIQYASFSAKLANALQMLSHRNKKVWLTLKQRDRAERVALDEVKYIEVSARDVLVHTKDKVIRQWGTLSSFEEKLRDEHFVRCNSCYLVNLRYVNGVYTNQADVGGEMLDISRPKRKEFLNALAQYKGGSR